MSKVIGQLYTPTAGDDVVSEVERLGMVIVWNPHTCQYTAVVNGIVRQTNMDGDALARYLCNALENPITNDALTAVINEMQLTADDWTRRDLPGNAVMRGLTAQAKAAIGIPKSIREQVADGEVCPCCGETECVRRG